MGGTVEEIRSRSRGQEMVVVAGSGAAILGSVTRLWLRSREGDTLPETQGVSRGAVESGREGRLGVGVSIGLGGVVGRELHSIASSSAL